MSADVAVIPAAGLGTRMLPATRAVPKSMLTVVDRPALQYPVEEAVRAGVSEVLVVVDEPAVELVERHFANDGGIPELGEAQIRTVIQEEPRGLGDAVRCAAEALDGRPFFCLLVDNIVLPGNDVLPSLAAGSRDLSVSVMCLRTVGEELLDKYGVVVPSSEVSEGYLDIEGAVEKPGVEAAPSRLGLVGRYVFTTDIFAALDGAEPGWGGEIQLTDAINKLGVQGKLRGFVSDQDLLDVGTPQGLVAASVQLAAPRYGKDSLGLPT